MTKSLEIVKKGNKHQVYILDCNEKRFVDITSLIKDISINIYPFERDIRLNLLSDIVKYTEEVTQDD